MTASDDPVQQPSTEALERAYNQWSDAAAGVLAK